MRIPINDSTELLKGKSNLIDIHGLITGSTPHYYPFGKYIIATVLYLPTQFTLIKEIIAA